MQRQSDSVIRAVEVGVQSQRQPKHLNCLRVSLGQLQFLPEKNERFPLFWGQANRLLQLSHRVVKISSFLEDNGQLNVSFSMPWIQAQDLQKIIHCCQVIRFAATHHGDS